VPIPEFVVDLRRHVGTAELWMPAVTAVVRRGDELLMVQRADNRRWTPVTGIMDPGEEPAVTAVREAREEACVEIRVDRLASVAAGPDNRVTHANGDLSSFLDLTFACTWLHGGARVGDDESVDVRWWPVADLPEMTPTMRARVDAALSTETTARFRT
jgi:8-oxo-dGTP pyrophosphatase MutT (NUDIX family)